MCDVCEGKTKYTSVHYELKIGDGFFKDRKYLKVTFEGCPRDAKCSKSQDYGKFIGEFEILYCPECGKKL